MIYAGRAKIFIDDHERQWSWEFGIYTYWRFVAVTEWGRKNWNTAINKVIFFDCDSEKETNRSVFMIRLQFKKPLLGDSSK